MPNASVTNPYAHSRTEQEFAEPDYAASAYGEYAVPSGNAPYNTEFGWSAHTERQPGNTPDPYRLGSEPLRQMRSNGTTAPAADPFYLSQDADDAKRHGVEFQDADGWTETADVPGYPSASLGANRFARNPREMPPAEPRATSRLAPRTYTFMRPFGVGLPKMPQRFLSGIHFSMADHRRTYDILGMEPVKNRRNTYRIEPAPWDDGYTDMPPAAPVEQREVPSVEVAYQSRSWRL